MNSRERWLEERKGHIGGSDAAAILGLSRFRTAWDVFVDKTAKKKPSKDDDAGKPWLARGRYLERAIGDWYSDEHGFELERKEHELIVGPEQWMSVTPDFLTKNLDPGHGVECKSSRSVDGWGDNGTDAVPVDVAIQSHWGMICTGLERWDVAVFLTLKDEFRSYVLKADPEVQQRLIEECGRWWERHVVKGIAPPMDGSSAAGEWIKRKFPRETEDLRQATSDEVEWAKRLQEIANQQSMLEKEARVLENQLKYSIGDAEGINWGPGPKKSKVTYKRQSRNGYTVKPWEGRVLRRNIQKF